MRKYNPKHKPKIRRGETPIVKKANQIIGNVIPITFNANNKKSLYKKMASKFGKSESQIRTRFESYLTAVEQNGGTDYGLDGFFDCNSCGFDKISVCIFGNCCGGSVGGGGSWEISCTRKIGKPKSDMLY